LREGIYDIAASRSYYAMFYTAEALLYSIGLSYSRHSAVIAAYGKEFAKTDLIPPEYHRYLIEAYESRQVADYGVVSIMTETKILEYLDQANGFLREAHKYLGADI
jgi:uncharacterized protein (UPF0332 family)